jgi:hypothetical protein
VPAPSACPRVRRALTLRLCCGGAVPRPGAPWAAVPAFPSTAGLPGPATRAGSSVPAQPPLGPDRQPVRQRGRRLVRACYTLYTTGLVYTGLTLVWPGRACYSPICLTGSPPRSAEIIPAWLTGEASTAARRGLSPSRSAQTLHCAALARSLSLASFLSLSLSLSLAHTPSLHLPLSPGVAGAARSRRSRPSSPRTRTSSTPSHACSPHRLLAEQPAPARLLSLVGGWSATNPTRPTRPPDSFIDSRRGPSTPSRRGPSTPSTPSLLPAPFSLRHEPACTEGAAGPAREYTALHACRPALSVVADGDRKGRRRGGLQALSVVAGACGEVALGAEAGARTRALVVEAGPGAWPRGLRGAQLLGRRLTRLTLEATPN